ncbi:GDP-L-fucose synthase family protein [Dickeya dadantii]|uniref:GDP-L-fucose synthase family protein n=1 Tax=Dickeya dadantii TaxID=204038 RepID=UPI0003A6C6D9|nr:GDP-L-fucose synthase [Dickeya dadantii]NAT77842.1 GDP-L-fucose synthase [Dickeya dadantii]NPE54633.1 GDP-L-fucose synthase [Dickeya dadantii]NPE64174.1 GDP-L-fucose synthase [Dickeya dadantii]NPE66048.1 GDP-L-fucose synthase [Dickeya dadantii]
MERKSKILITGAGGVLGYGLTDALAKNGYDNVLTPNRDEMNCLSQESVDDYFNQHQPDYVFHLASLVFGLKGNLDNQLKSISNNTIINQNVILACHKFNVKKIFFAGTVASYPFPYVQLPLDEGDLMLGEPHGGEYGYAMSKRHALAYLKILNQYHNVDYCYALFTNLFGANDKFDPINGHVIPSLIDKTYNSLLRGDNQLTVWGRPETTRDFLYNKQAGLAALHVMNNLSGVVNIASGVETSMGDIVNAIARYYDNKITAVWDANAPIGIPKRSVSIKRLNDSGFQPEFDLNLQISDTISWYENNISRIRK